MEEFNGVKVNGRYRTIVKRADGRIEESEWKNTISAEFLTALKNSLATSQDYALNNLMDEAHLLTSGDNGYDGIVLNTSEFVEDQWYTTDCSLGDGSPTYSKKVTGVFTGFAKTIYDAHLGFNANGPSIGEFAVMFATPTSWSNITLAVADELTIEWTISFS